jgi:predicted Zn-dependent protease
MSLLAAAAALALAGHSDPCPVALTSQRLPPPADRAGPAPAAAAPDGGDYRHRLQATPFGWPHRPHWCVWVEPAAAEGPSSRWEQAWRQAVDSALAHWAELLPITRVQDPERAQVLVFRRRPPLRGGRASHGRAELDLVLVRRQQPSATDGRGLEQLEPRVSVSVSPGQRAEAIEATALHELGHAFGLWGHSDDPADAMAAVPGAKPIRRLSGRDRATLQWLQRQPGLSPAAPSPGLH